MFRPGAKLVRREWKMSKKEGNKEKQHSFSLLFAFYGLLSASYIICEHAPWMI